MDKKFRDTMDTVVTAVRNERSESFMKTHQQISPTVSVPQKVFCTSDNDVSAIFGKGLKDFESHFVHTDAIQTLAVFASEVEKDAFIALESEFLNKLVTTL
jgi:hypothetical protein